MRLFSQPSIDPTSGQQQAMTDPLLGKTMLTSETGLIKENLCYRLTRLLVSF
jgi:hypothetical protein